jgi:hypothetical protein
MAMLVQFLVGGIVCVCTITIHALVMTVVVRVARAWGTKKRSHPSLRLITVMIATVSVLMAAHVLEVFVWSLAYSIVDAAPAGTNLVYFAFVNYATLGYGDVIPVEGWRLLGPITAMNGALMFGWSTAVIYEVLQKTMMISFDTAVPE